MSAQTGVHEIRWNPLIKQWIIIAGHRGKRTWRPEGRNSCPFCPGAPEVGKDSSWRVKVLPNRFPALSPSAPKTSGPNSPPLRSMRARGYCKVVVETPSHEGDLSGLPLEHASEVVKAYASETERLSRENDQIRRCLQE